LKFSWPDQAEKLARALPEGANLEVKPVGLSQLPCGLKPAVPVRQRLTPRPPAGSQFELGDLKKSHGVQVAQAGGGFQGGKK
jgi:hypothetical protein